MPQNGELCVFGRHAGAVVADQNAGGPAVAKLYFYAGGPGVQGVFDEFFYDGGGTIHDLPGGDLLGHPGGQDFDIHNGSSIRVWNCTTGVGLSHRHACRIPGCVQSEQNQAQKVSR